jgi:cytosine/adenosine deaminase-related metal-dependent hydrolase
MTRQKYSHPVKKNQPMIHRAPWIVTDVSSEIYGSTQGIIEDGALITSEGFIKAVGKSKDIIREFPSYPIQEYECSILAPALINSHCHLELSYLDLAENDQVHSTYNGDPTLWIRDILKARDNFSLNHNDPENQILSHAGQTLLEMSAEGVGFVGDIGNSLASRLVGQGQSTNVSFLLELLGLSRESEAQSLARLESVVSDDTLDVSCTAHAPYSTTPVLMQKIKNEADRQGHIFSIHAAESRQEIEFLQTGTGHFLDFLRERGAWDNSFSAPGMGSVQYLENLGILNDKTLCVHVVHVDHGEVEILASRKAKICLCPGSNRFLGVGKAPVTEFLAHGILPALGTDSKASNSVLSIWREMRLLREDHPGLSPETVFSMATRGGAEAWGVDSEMGTLEPEKHAQILTVPCDGNVKSSEDILEYMTTSGESIQVDWLELGHYAE